MSDCERFHEGLLAEPANALSSLAYVAAGVWVWRRDRVAGGALVAVGLGSVAYHGACGAGARWLHDATIVVLGGVVAVAIPRIARGAPAHPKYVVLAGSAFALALPLQLFGRTGGRVCRPDSVLQAHAGWHILTAAALTAAFALAAGARRDGGVTPPRTRRAGRGTAARHATGRRTTPGGRGPDARA